MRGTSTVGAPGNASPKLGAPGEGSSVVGAPISVGSGSSGSASYIETFPSCDVSSPRESPIPQLDGSDPSPKSKPFFHGSNKSTTEYNPPPVSTVCLDIVVLTSVNFA